LDEPVESVHNLVDFVGIADAPNKGTVRNERVLYLPRVREELPDESLGVVGVSETEVTVLLVGNVAYLIGVESGRTGNSTGRIVELSVIEVF